jgi:hypothetical protein
MMRCSFRGNGAARLTAILDMGALPRCFNGSRGPQRLCSAVHILPQLAAPRCTAIIDMTRAFPAVSVAHDKE